MNAVNNNSGRTAGGYSPWTRLIWILAIVLLVIGFAWSLVNYLKVKKQLSMLATPEGQQNLLKQETAEIVAKVGRLIVLPQDETPTIATIADAEKISQEQPFYQNAHNGDKVLIYVQAKKAIIYDATRDILVNVGPVFIENSGETKTEANTGQPTVPAEIKILSVEVRNGSATKGVAATWGDELKKESTFNVVNVDTAANADYQGNVIVDLSQGDKIDLLSALQAKFPNASLVKVLPAGEKPTTAEVLVIIGN